MKNTVWIFLLSVTAWLELVNPAPLATRTVIAPIKIVTTVNEQTIRIVKKNEEIEYMINTAEDSIKNSLEELVQFIAERKIAAAESGLDIAACLAETILIDEIDTNEIRQCSIKGKLDELTTQLLKIGNRGASLVEGIVDILTGNEDLESVIIETEKDLTSLVSEIEEALSEGFSTALFCTESHLGSLDQQINMISTEFTRCLDTFEEF